MDVITSPSFRPALAAGVFNGRPVLELETKLFRLARIEYGRLKPGVKVEPERLCVVYMYPQKDRVHAQVERNVSGASASRQAKLRGDRRGP